MQTKSDFEMIAATVKASAGVVVKVAETVVKPVKDVLGIVPQEPKSKREKKQLRRELVKSTLQAKVAERRSRRAAIKPA